jgi:hypothetical protein
VVDHRGCPGREDGLAGATPILYASHSLEPATRVTPPRAGSESDLAELLPGRLQVVERLTSEERAAIQSLIDDGFEAWEAREIVLWKGCLRELGQAPDESESES